MTDDQPNDGANSGAIRARRRRRTRTRSEGAEKPDRTSALSAIRRLFQEPARVASPDVSQREAEEELREAMSPALEKLVEGTPGVSSSEEAADVLTPHPGSNESEGGENSNRREFVAGDAVETVDQYPVRDHSAPRPAVAQPEPGQTDLAPVGGSPVALDGSGPADPSEYISAFAERMRARSDQDRG